LRTLTMKSALTTLLIALAAVTTTLAPSAAHAAVSAVTAAPALSAVTLNVTDVSGGTPVIGTVTLNGAATPGGVAVALTSDNTAAATVPASVIVPAGARSATFPVTTLVVPNPQSSLIIGTAAGVTAYAIITVRTQFQATNGSISILPAGNGSGTITSQPAGISCTVTLGSGAGACSSFFPKGTVVKLVTQARSGSKFQGWRGTPGCGDPSRITVVAGTNITCQGGFVLK
jgi:hypothetical protein